MRAKLFLFSFFFLLFAELTGVAQTLAVQPGGYPVKTEETAAQKRNTEARENVNLPPRETRVSEIAAEEKKPFWNSAWNKTKDYFSTVFSKDTAKTEEEPRKKSVPDETATDNGLKEIAEWLKEQRYAEPEYVDSATRSQKAAAKDTYRQGLQAENAGNVTGAIRFYSAFIEANNKQVLDGTLAAPYHRLALMAWKQQGTPKNAAIYFRYAMKYARGGNVPIIAGDYALFLTEQNDLKEAEVVLRNALSHYADDKRLLFCLAVCTAGQDRPIEAVRYFTEAVGEDRAYQEMAALYRKRGEWEFAQHFDEKRYEYLARNNRNQIPDSIAGMKITPPPQAVTKKNSELRAANDAQIKTLFPDFRSSFSENHHLMPYPTFDNPENRRAFSPIMPGQTNPAASVPSGNGWQSAVQPPPMPFVPVPPPVETMPVSQVIHYPENSENPAYYEYQRKEYPGETAAQRNRIPAQ